MYSVKSRIKNQELGWYGHLIKMGEDRLLKRVWEVTLPEKKQWEDQANGTKE